MNADFICCGWHPCRTHMAVAQCETDDAMRLQTIISHGNDGVRLSHFQGCIGPLGIAGKENLAGRLWIDAGQAPYHKRMIAVLLSFDRLVQIGKGILAQNADCKRRAGAAKALSGHSMKGANLAR